MNYMLLVLLPTVIILKFIHLLTNWYRPKLLTFPISQTVHQFSKSKLIQITNLTLPVLHKTKIRIKVQFSLLKVEMEISNIKQGLPMTMVSPNSWLSTKLLQIICLWEKKVVICLKFSILPVVLH